MSVNSKMTALADKIRLLLGIRDTMSLDAMAEKLETERANITGAFTAIGSKGGTIPDAAVSGNLTAAIQSIPDYVPVQSASGTVTVSYDAERNTYVTCGFEPDIVMIHGMIYSSNGKQSDYQLTAFLKEQKEGYRYVYEGYCDDAANGWKRYTFEIYPADNGFRLYNVYCYDPTNEYTYCEGEQFQYLAIKYTP